MAEKREADDETIPETQFVSSDSHEDSDSESEDDSNKKYKEKETPKEYKCCFESNDSDMINPKSIFVKGFDCSFPLDEIKSTLKDAFSTCGEVSRVYIPYHCKSGSPSGFAFVNMRKDEEAALKLDGTRLGEMTLEVTMAKRRSEYVGYTDHRGCGSCNRNLRERRWRRFYYNYRNRNDISSEGLSPYPHAGPVTYKTQTFNYR